MQCKKSQEIINKTYQVSLTPDRSFSTFLLHASKRVVLAFSLEGALYPFGALLIAVTIFVKKGLRNILNGTPLAAMHSSMLKSTASRSLRPNASCNDLLGAPVLDFEESPFSFALLNFSNAQV